MTKRRIAQTELAIGSVLEWDVYDEAGRLLLRKGQTVSRESHVEALKERGLFIQVEGPRQDPPAPLSTSAVALILDAREQLELACSARTHADGFSDRILAIRHLIGSACDLSTDAALAMSLLARTGRYSIRHSVDAAVACHVVGRASGMNEEELTYVVAAALTMNLSMLQLQDELQAQEAPLTEAQREAVQGHPEASAMLLSKLGVNDRTWLETVASHHEALDGSGYKGAKADEIPKPAQLVSLADIYCARISSRTYRAPLTPHAALRALFAEQGKKVRQELAAAFIRAVGVFPSGTPVRLVNGELAVVTGRGAGAKTPDVLAIKDASGMPLVRPVKRDTSDPMFAVREVVSWSELGAPPSMQTLWGKVAAVT
jgi:HD-GYP domain-containing protein (c-di-GMP phosphodiesterase class II)